MSRRDAPPFRADHVGSLLRPKALIDARRQRAAGTLGEGDLRALEDEAIRDAVAMQKSLGLESATDGEYRRAFWNMDFLWALGGVDREDDNPVNVQFKDDAGKIEFRAPAARVVGPVTLPETIFGEHFSFLSSVVEAGVTAKITIPSPSTIFRGARKLVPESVYPALDSFWHDIEAVYAAQVKGLYELGCRYLQLDDTALAFLTDARPPRGAGEGRGAPSSRSSSRPPPRSGRKPEERPSNARSRPSSPRSRTPSGRRPDFALPTSGCALPMSLVS